LNFRQDLFKFAVFFGLENRHQPVWFALRILILIYEWFQTPGTWKFCQILDWFIYYFFTDVCRVKLRLFLFRKNLLVMEFDSRKTTLEHCCGLRAASLNQRALDSIASFQIRQKRKVWLHYSTCAVFFIIIRVNVMNWIMLWHDWLWTNLKLFWLQIVSWKLWCQLKAWLIKFLLNKILVTSYHWFINRWVNAQRFRRLSIDLEVFDLRRIETNSFFAPHVLDASWMEHSIAHTAWRLT